MIFSNFWEIRSLIPKKNSFKIFADWDTKEIYLDPVNQNNLNNFERFNFMQESYGHNFVPKAWIKKINQKQPRFVILSVNQYFQEKNLY